MAEARGMDPAALRDYVIAGRPGLGLRAGWPPTSTPGSTG